MLRGPRDRGKLVHASQAFEGGQSFPPDKRVGIPQQPGHLPRRRPNFELLHAVQHLVQSRFVFGARQGSGGQERQVVAGSPGVSGELDEHVRPPRVLGSADLLRRVGDQAQGQGGQPVADALEGQEPADARGDLRVRIGLQPFKDGDGLFAEGLQLLKRFVALLNVLRSELFDPGGGIVLEARGEQGRTRRALFS